MTDSTNDPFSSKMAAFAATYANWESPQTVCLTFDQDWAPDYMLSHVLDILDEYQATATFLATNPSSQLSDRALASGHEIGLHPNLAPNSTQGDGTEDIIHRLRKDFPNAEGTRFHLLGHSYRDLMLLGEAGFHYDVSTFRFNCPYLLPAWQADLGMTLLTYCWEDGYTTNDAYLTTVGSIAIDTPGMKIVNFHPLNVFLNCAQTAHKSAFQKAVPDMSSSNKGEAMQYRFNGQGVESVLREFLNLLNKREIRTATLKDLTAAYRDAGA